MYTFSKQTREEFLEKVGIDIQYLFDELCSREVRDAIVALAEIEYTRGYNDGKKENQDDFDALMEEHYNAGYTEGYDDAMEECTMSREDAYNEGFGQALQEAQDAILHIGRAR